MRDFFKYCIWWPMKLVLFIAFFPVILLFKKIKKDQETKPKREYYKVKGKWHWR